MGVKGRVITIIVSVWILLSAVPVSSQVSWGAICDNSGAPFGSFLPDLPSLGNYPGNPYTSVDILGGSGCSWKLLPIAENSYLTPNNVFPVEANYVSYSFWYKTPVNQDITVGLLTTDVLGNPNNIFLEFPLTSGGWNEVQFNFDGNTAEKKASAGLSFNLLDSQQTVEIDNISIVGFEPSTATPTATSTASPTPTPTPPSAGDCMPDSWDFAGNDPMGWSWNLQGFPDNSVCQLGTLTGDWSSNRARVYCTRQFNNSWMRQPLEYEFAPGEWTTAGTGEQVAATVFSVSSPGGANDQARIEIHYTDATIDAPGYTTVGAGGTALTNAVDAGHVGKEVDKILVRVYNNWTGNSGTAQLHVDDINVTCNNPPPTPTATATGTATATPENTATPTDFPFSTATASPQFTGTPGQATPTGTPLSFPDPGGDLGDFGDSVLTVGTASAMMVIPSTPAADFMAPDFMTYTSDVVTGVPALGAIFLLFFALIGYMLFRETIGNWTGKGS